MCHAIFIVLCTGQYPCLCFRICHTLVHCTSAFPTFDKSCKYPIIAPCVRSFAHLYLFLHKIVSIYIHKRFMHVLYLNPFLRLFIPKPADLETVVCFLRRYRADIDGIGDYLLDCGEIPHINALFTVFLFPFCHMVSQAFLSVPPTRSGDFLILQSAPDPVRAMPFSRPPEYFLHNPGSVFVWYQKILILW